MLRVGDLPFQHFLASAFFIAKLIDMTRLDNFPKVSVSIHGLAVYFIEITATRLIQFDLCWKNIVFHTGNCLFIVFIFHRIRSFHNKLEFACIIDYRH